MTDIIWSVTTEHIKEELKSLEVYENASEDDQGKMAKYVADKIWHDLEKTLAKATLAYAEIYAEELDCYTPEDIEFTEEMLNKSEGWPV